MHSPTKVEDLLPFRNPTISASVGGAWRYPDS